MQTNATPTHIKSQRRSQQHTLTPESYQQPEKTHTQTPRKRTSSREVVTSQSRIQIQNKINIFQQDTQTPHTQISPGLRCSKSGRIQIRRKNPKTRKPDALTRLAVHEPEPSLSMNPKVPRPKSRPKKHETRHPNPVLEAEIEPETRPRTQNPDVLTRLAAPRSHS